MPNADNPEEPNPTNENAPHREVSPRPQRKRRRFRVWGILLLLVIGGFVWFRHERATENQRQATSHETPAIPVVAGTVIQKDVPIYLEGLGTVQALNTVTIHVRVDGQLDKVAFKEGQDVRTGDLLAQIDPKPFQAQLDQALAKKQQDEAQLANARLDYKRNTDMLAKHVISQQVYDTQKALMLQLEATVKADQAAIESAQVQLGYTTIYSPLNGRTGIRLVDQGNIVHASDPGGLVVITQLNPISVLFTLPEQNLAEIQAQSHQGAFTVLAVGRENAIPLATGTLAVIDNQIDTATGTIRLKANFPNTEHHLWPGQFVNARLLLTTRKNAVVIPATAVQRGPEGLYAFVIKDDLTVDVRPIKVGLTQAGESLVDEGLSPGERIVVEGYYRLQAHSRVKIARTVATEEAK